MEERQEIEFVEKPLVGLWLATGKRENECEESKIVLYIFAVNLSKKIIFL